MMLRAVGPQVESLFELGLPVEVAELPEDLAALDRLLSDPVLLAPIAAAWSPRAAGHGRPTIADGTLRAVDGAQAALAGWGYETLVREVSDSIICGGSAGSR